MEQDQPQPLIPGLIPHNRRRFSFPERRRFFVGLPNSPCAGGSPPQAPHALLRALPFLVSLGHQLPTPQKPTVAVRTHSGFPLTSMLPRTRSGRHTSTPRQTKSALARRLARTFPRVRARPPIFRFLPSPFTSRPKPLAVRELRGEGFIRFCLHLPLPLRSSAQRRVRSFHAMRIFTTQSINLQNKG